MQKEDTFKLFLLQNGFDPEGLMQIIKLHPSLLDVYEFDELAPLCLLSSKLLKKKHCYIYLPEFLYDIVAKGNPEAINRVLEQLIFKEFSGPAVDVIDSHLDVAKNLLGK